MSSEEYIGLFYPAARPLAIGVVEPDALVIVDTPDQCRNVPKLLQAVREQCTPSCQKCDGLSGLPFVSMRKGSIHAVTLWPLYCYRAKARFRCIFFSFLAPPGYRTPRGKL